MYSYTISLRYFFPRARILNEIAEFEKMPLNPKTAFNSYNIQIEICVFIFIKICKEYYHEIIQKNTAIVGINPQTSLGSSALGVYVD